MITIISKEAGLDGRELLSLVGTSNDIKPTGKLNGSKFVEIDTGKTFLYNEDAESGSEWVDQSFPEDETTPGEETT